MEKQKSMSEQTKESSTEKKSNGTLNKIADKMGIILMWGMILLFVIMAIYVTKCSLEDDYYISRARQVWGMCIFGIILGAAITRMDYVVNKRLKKAAYYDPAKGRLELPDVSKRGLDQILIYMSGRPILLVWDIMWGGAILPMLFLLFAEIEYYGMIAAFILVLVIFLVVGHIVFTIYYEHRPYRRKMITATRRYINIADEEMFCEALEKNLMEKMIYRSKCFVVSEDYIIGYTNWNTSFQPTAIPVRAITSAEYRLEYRNIKPRGTQGILSCRLSNGNMVVMCASQGTDADKIPKVLNYCGIPYTYR